MSGTVEAKELYGLYTGQSMKRAPVGSLRDCRNVVCHSPGLLEPRPGFQVLATPAAGILPARILPWRSKGEALSVNLNGKTAWVDDVAGGTLIKDEAGADLTWDNYCWSAEEARKNFYISTKDGVRKLTDGSDHVADLSGIAETPIVVNAATTGASGFLADTMYVGYAVLLRRDDANGLIVRSHGLGHANVRNSSGGTRNVSVPIYFGPGIAAGDILEVYRTEQGTVPPDREFFLCKTYTVTSADVSAKHYTFTDAVADADLGAALYTNDSEGGIAAANMRGSRTTRLALFNNSLFSGALVSPNRFTLRWKDSQNTTGSATGIGYRGYSGKRTNGSATITSMSSVVGLEVGMMLDDCTSWSGTAPVVITAVGASSITMSATWGGATDGGAVAIGNLLDTVAVTIPSLTGTQVYFPVAMFTSDAGSALSGFAAFLKTFNCGDTKTRNTAATDYYAYATLEYGSAATAAIVIEEKERNALSPTIAATKNTEHLNTIASISTGTSAFTLDLLVNAVEWSKYDEPEHYTLSGFMRIGSASAPILSIKSTLSALWIFKTDGTFRLSGVAEPDWRLDEVDRSIVVIAPDCVVQHGEVIYAWTNHGPMQFSDDGIVPMSPKSNEPCQIADDLDYLQRTFADTSVVQPGLWMAVEEIKGWVLLGVGIAGASVSNAIYCFSTATRQWSKWYVDATNTGAGSLRAICHMAFEPVSAKLLAVDLTQVLCERASDDNVPFAVSSDREWSIVVNAVSGTTVTIDPGSGWTPKVGDAIRQLYTTFVVTAVTSATVFTVHDATTDVTTGVTYTTAPVVDVAKAYEGFEVSFTLNAVGLPTYAARWLQCNIAFQTYSGVKAYTYTFTTDKNTAGVSTSVTTKPYRQPAELTLNPTADYLESLRMLSTRATSRARVLTAKWSSTQACAMWRANSASVFLDSVTERVAR